MNEYDSNRIFDSVKKIGYQKSENLEEADCYLLNTCHIRDKAKEKVYSEIGRVKKSFRAKKKPLVIIAKVMSEASDHPNVDELYNRVSKIDPKISIATVYRTVKLFEETGILTKHEFKGGKARYEELNESHHDHLIDVKTGEIIEFVDEEIEKLQKKVAQKHGYKLVDHKLELYGVKKKS